VSQGDISLGPHQGKEIIVSIKERDAIMKSRVYVIGSTEYILQVWTPVPLKDNAEKNKFLKSLKLIQNSQGVDL